MGASCAGDAEAVRGDRTGDAVRDGGTHRSLPRQRRGKLGVQGGRSVPLARPQCLTLRGLAYVRYLPPVRRSLLGQRALAYTYHWRVFTTSHHPRLPGHQSAREGYLRGNY